MYDLCGVSLRSHLPGTLLFTEAILFHWVETKRGMDLKKPGSQADGSFFGITEEFMPKENGYPGETGSCGTSGRQHLAVTRDSDSYDLTNVVVFEGSNQLLQYCCGTGVGQSCTVSANIMRQWVGGRLH